MGEMPAHVRGGANNSSTLGARAFDVGLLEKRKTLIKCYYKS